MLVQSPCLEMIFMDLCGLFPSSQSVTSLERKLEIFYYYYSVFFLMSHSLIGLNVSFFKAYVEFYKNSNTLENHTHTKQKKTNPCGYRGVTVLSWSSSPLVLLFQRTIHLLDKVIACALTPASTNGLMSSLSVRRAHL